MVKKNNRNNDDVKFPKNNRNRIAVEKWTIDIASLWKLTIVEVYTVAWATWPERPKDANDEVKSPEGPPARCQGPESP